MRLHPRSASYSKALCNVRGLKALRTQNRRTATRRLHRVTHLLKNNVQILQITRCVAWEDEQQRGKELGVIRANKGSRGGVMPDHLHFPAEEMVSRLTTPTGNLPTGYWQQGSRHVWCCVGVISYYVPAHCAQPANITTQKNWTYVRNGTHAAGTQKALNKRSRTSSLAQSREA